MSPQMFLLSGLPQVLQLSESNNEKLPIRFIPAVLALSGPVSGMLAAPTPS